MCTDHHSYYFRAEKKVKQRRRTVAHCTDFPVMRPGLIDMISRARNSLRAASALSSTAALTSASDLNSAPVSVSKAFYGYSQVRL